MKKMLLALVTLISLTCFSQTTGHFRYDTVRIYKVGGNSTLAIENDTRDSLGFLYNYGNGRTRFEVIRAVAGGIQVGGDTIIVNTSCEDGVVTGRTISWEGGFRFHVQEGIIRLDCQLYALDSITLTLDSSDADDRFDVIYDDVDGAHVLEGVPATPAAIPQVEGGQIHLTAILIEAGALNPSVSSVNVYFENDATITPSGTTAVGNSTVDPFAGTFHIRITTINNGDFVDIIKPSGTWDISDQDALVIHVKNRAVVPQLANLRVSLWNGSSTGSQVSGEVILNYNKNLTSGYQAIAIPMSAFGQINNTNIDRVRLRFTSNNANNFTGYDIDNVFFEDGVDQPGNNGTGQFNLNLPSFLTLTPSNTIVTNNTTYTITANGTTAQYVRGDGSLATFSAVTGVGTFNTQTASNNGAEISGTNIFFHPVSATVNGMATPTMKEKWDSIYYAENMSLLGDSIMVSIAVDRIGFKSLVEGSGITITPTDSTLIIEASGGSSLLPVTGTGTATGGAIAGELEGESLMIRSAAASIGLIQILTDNTGDGGDDIQYLEFTDNQNMKIGGSYLLGTAETQYKSDGVVRQNSTLGLYEFENLADDLTATKVVVYNTTSDQIGTVDLAGLGGGGGVTSVDTWSTTSDAEGLSITGTAIKLHAASAANPGGIRVGTGLAIDGSGILSATGTVGALWNGLFGGTARYTGNATLAGGTSDPVQIVSENTAPGATITMPTLSGNGNHAYFFKNEGTDDLTIARAGSDQFYTTTTVTSVTIPPGESRLIMSSGVLWHVHSGGGGGGSGATTALDNLAAVAINTSLISDADNTDDLGSAANGWKDGYFRRILLDGATSGTITIASDALSNVALGTNLSGAGIIPFVQTINVRSDETLANSSSDQNLFASTHDVITVQANTTYEFYITGDLTHGAVSHSIALGFTPTTAVVTSIEYNSDAWVTAVGTATASQVTNRVKATATTVINLAGANAVETFRASGTITIGATGGTITPQIKFSADPTGTILLKAGARMHIWPIGNNTFTEQGNIN